MNLTLNLAPSKADLQDKSIDELTKFIDGGSKKSKAGLGQAP